MIYLYWKLWVRVEYEYDASSNNAGTDIKSCTRAILVSTGHQDLESYVRVLINVHASTMKIMAY